MPPTSVQSLSNSQSKSLTGKDGPRPSDQSAPGIYVRSGIIGQSVGHMTGGILEAVSCQL
jgi:hypothetical protein